MTDRARRVNNSAKIFWTGNSVATRTIFPGTDLRRDSATYAPHTAEIGPNYAKSRPWPATDNNL